MNQMMQQQNQMQTPDGSGNPFNNFSIEDQANYSIAFNTFNSNVQNAYMRQFLSNSNNFQQFNNNQMNNMQSGRNHHNEFQNMFNQNN